MEEAEEDSINCGGGDRDWVIDLLGVVAAQHRTGHLSY